MIVIEEITKETGIRMVTTRTAKVLDAELIRDGPTSGTTRRKCLPEDADSAELIGTPLSI